MYMTKSPIQRFQELIQFATISANGPQGVYEEVGCTDIIHENDLNMSMYLL